MKWMSLNEIREKYLAFFESKGHLRLKSFPLVPGNDKSLLLINSGMAPMKKYFTGEITPPRERVTTCQKCIRTPDIECVGKTARHGTFFEMLGNFSFGDYFKNDATAWAYEFCTNVMELPEERIWISIYEDDDETFKIWTENVGFPAEKIVRLGKADNFWEHGAGPCGPCSELYFDRGEKYGCGSENCSVGCKCDRFVEFWNLVFTQFESDGAGTYTPLSHPNIDTGMGLERLACIMQEVDNLFEVDTMQDIMKHISGIAGVEYKTDAKTDVSLRVITDHIRSTVFMIGDGVLPSNEGRGYVLRRLLRRAARHGRILGINHPFLSEVAETVAKANETCYPEIMENLKFIQKIISVEEEAFGRTIDQGLELLADMIGRAKNALLSGEDAFKLYDTFGFPLDLTVDVLEEQGMRVDSAAFDELMLSQRKRAREARKNAGADAWKGTDLLPSDLPKTVFTGYETLNQPAKILSIIKDDEAVAAVSEGDCAIVLDITGFYAESGGQVGDTGIISADGNVFSVDKTVKTESGYYMHSGKMIGGTLSVGDEVIASVDADMRAATCRNHTSAHLLQAALKTVLGDHVKQAGSLVEPGRVRFDFTHFSALTTDELMRVENEVNHMILDALPVSVKEMSIEEAKAIGATALFGEKYGDVVRVVQCGEASIELCGGTHVDNTSKIGLFKTLSETSVAAGVRRIEAVTGTGVLDLLYTLRSTISEAAASMKASAETVVVRAAALVAEARQKDKELFELKAQIADMQTRDIFDKTTEIGGMQVISAAVNGIEPDAARGLIDKMLSRNPEFIVVIAAMSSDKVTLVAGCGKSAVAAGAHAGNIVKEAAKIIGGGGGGRPDSAMAGGKDLSKVDDCIRAINDIVSVQLNK